MRINYGFTDLASGETLVLKPHGSCNFLPSGISGIPGSISIGAGASVDMPLQIVGDLSEVIQHALTNPFPPMMCLFMEGKPTQVGPGTVTAQLKRWQDEVGKASASIIVGVHPNVKDTHVWDSIAASSGPIGYVGPAQDAFEEWASTADVTARATYISAGFEAGLGECIEIAKKVSGDP